MTDGMLKLKVPATTANIGPGYDALGIALDLYNEFTVEKTAGGLEFIWDTENPDITDENNLILQALKFTLNKYGVENLGCRITVDACNIPVSRGLGSSAASIVAGIFIADYLMGNTLNRDDVLNIATELEGHPDNVAPAIFGNMIISIMEEDKVFYSKLNIPEALVFNVMIPNFELSTKMARSVLPEFYSTSECVSNVSRTALLINALSQGELHLLRPALVDKLHQPYRLQLINDSFNIFAKAEELKSLGEFISGAGPTLIALSNAEDEQFPVSMQSYLNSLQDTWKLYNMKVNTVGTIVEVK